MKHLFNFLTGAGRTIAGPFMVVGGLCAFSAAVQPWAFLTGQSDDFMEAGGSLIYHGFSNSFYKGPVQMYSAVKDAFFTAATDTVEPVSALPPRQEINDTGFETNKLKM